MATGDQSDMAARMRAVLPAGWFPDEAPVLSALLAGFGSVWNGVWVLFVYLLAQLRIATAARGILDLISGDFFASALPRRAGESDDAFRARIKREMFRERGTRQAVLCVLTDLVGNPPAVFEPAHPRDAGGYAAAGSQVCTGLAYGRAGGWGSLQLPYQFFVVGRRGSRSPIANCMGYYTGSGWAGGGYGAGAIQYVSPDWTEGQVTDGDLFAAAASVLPANAIAWMALTDTAPGPVPPNAVTGLAAA